MESKVPSYCYKEKGLVHVLINKISVPRISDIKNKNISSAFYWSFSLWRMYSRSQTPWDKIFWCTWQDFLMSDKNLKSCWPKKYGENISDKTRSDFKLPPDRNNKPGKYFELDSVCWMIKNLKFRQKGGIELCQISD